MRTNHHQARRATHLFALLLITAAAPATAGEIPRLDRPDTEGRWDRPFGERLIISNDFRLPNTDVSERWRAEPNSSQDLVRGQITGRGWANNLDTTFRPKFYWDIANAEVLFNTKTLWLTYWIWSDQGGFVDVQVTAPNAIGSQTEIQSEDRANGWKQYYHLYTITPQPSQETIVFDLVIAPRGSVAIAYPHYQTKCIPAPSVVGLVGLGLPLFVTRRRRGERCPVR